MAMYSQGNKRQKTNTRESSKAYDSSEYFSGITRLEYRPEAGADDSLCYRIYNPTERVHGRTMEDWIRPAVSFWHAFHYQGADSYGQETFVRKWEDGTNSHDTYKRRLRAAFELFSKLGVKYWTVFDRDMAPDGDNLEESNHMLDESMDLVMELQQRYGVKPLWFGCNLFSNTRYMNGAATNPDCQVVACAAAQLKKAMEVAHKMGAENFLIWGAREGYQNPLTADMNREMRLYGRFLKMAVDYKDKMGYRGQLLLRPGPQRDTRDGSGLLAEGRYDYDATSALCMLKHHGLDKYYKLSVTPGHEHLFAAAYGALGSLNVTSRYKHSNPVMMDPYGPDMTLYFKTVLEQGGIQPGGVSMEMLLRRESTDLKDMFVLYAQGLDAIARSLKSSVRLITDGYFAKHLQQRYIGYQSAGLGQRLANGEATLEECEDYVKRHGDPPSLTSAHLEHWAAMFRFYN